MISSPQSRPDKLPRGEAYLAGFPGDLSRASGFIFSPRKAFFIACFSTSMMDYSQACENLIKLLCCNIETLSFEKIKELVRKRYRQWHPDKNHDNPEKYRENFMLLKESFDVYKKGPPQDSGVFTADDLFCDENWDPSWDQFGSENSDEEYNSTPFDDDFFNASPKKNFAVPDDLRLFFRSKTNRRAGKLFMIFSFQDSVHLKCFEHLSKDHFTSFAVFSGRTNKEIYCTLVLKENEIRLQDLKKICRQHSLYNTEIFYAVQKKRLYEKLIDMYGQPDYTHGTPFEKPPAEETAFSMKQLTDFAISTQQTNVMLLMYEYAHLASACDRPAITKEHDEDHINEKLNAQRFLKLSDRYKVCSSAIKCVTAELCGKLHQISNTKWLENRSQEFSDRLIDNDRPDVFGEAYYYWKYILGKEKFYNIVAPLIGVFTNSECKKFGKGTKKRYVVLRGMFDCGKTTLAAAICKFFDGVNINVNISRDRLPFYIGSAIGKRFVLFDDVKGYKTKVDGLPTGNGLNNLDELREHLDGKIEVQLERKNQNPINQVFPSGIITMNPYKIPQSLKVRFHIVNMRPNPMYKKHHYSITMDTIFIAMVLDNLIPCDKDCIAHIYKQKQRWLAEHRSKCRCMDIMVS